MKIMPSTTKMQYVLIFVFLCISQSSYCDDIQEQLDFNNLRTPEASAFKKYGEECINEYTGTVDISVPLYSVKCKDLKIPLVLRYDASGIKVEQEASWVGLRWNLMVGGCINYVCAGGHDIYGSVSVPNSVWTEYLTSDFGPWTNGTAIEGGAINTNNIVSRSRTKYYSYDDSDRFNWMNTLPYSPQNFVMSYVDQFIGGEGMKEYIDWGYGERDFYSVNVMGKSFMFFIDPFTLKVFNIGNAGEEFIVCPEYYTEPQTGIGKQPDIIKWEITDSDGYVYEFAVGDKYRAESRNNSFYTSCWYLTKMKTPLGETAVFNYSTLTNHARQTMVESHKIPFFHDGGAFCCGNVSRQEYTRFLQNDNSNMDVLNHYLSEIKTRNQVVIFHTADCDECSGRKLDEISIKTNDRDSTVLKKISFTYGSFRPSNTGGNYAPNDPSIHSENRLKLNNVKEIALSDTLTTFFSYNEEIRLPSKRSCAQDYWGYYNGKENNVQGRGYSLLPSPQKFMSSRTNDEIEKLSGIKGADRFSHGDFMQAAILNKVVYPSGGYTTYEYEPNIILTNDFSLTEKYREKQYDVNIHNSFSGLYTPEGYTESGTRRYEFTIAQNATCNLLLTSGGASQLYGKNLNIEIRKWNENILDYVLFREINIDFQSYNDPTIIIEGLSLSKGNYYIGTTLEDYRSNQFGYTWYLQGWNKDANTNGPVAYPLACGGLRIKKICNYDKDNTIINYSTCDYSGGELLNNIETIDYTQMYNFRPDHDPVYGNVADKTHSIDVYTITQGHPHMPAFYASCNPGIVGYSYVTKKEYDSDDILMKKVVTSYKNNVPTNTYGIDYYTILSNGQMLCREFFDGNNIMAKKEYTYTNELVDHYAANIITRNKCINGSNALPVSYTEYQTVYNKDGSFYATTVNWSDGSSEGVFDVLRYPYILSRTELAKTKTTEYCAGSTSSVTTTDYSYDDINHQISQIDESTSQPSLTRRTKITYSADVPDYICNLKSVHRLNDVVEQNVFMVENNQEICMSSQRTDYFGHRKDNTTYYLPVMSSASIGGQSLEARARYSYDDSLNVCSIITDRVETVYIWSYKGQYPIAKIEGLTYRDVESVLGESTISALLAKQEPSQEDFASIRNAINDIGGLITTYTYKPLVGIKSQTSPNGMTIHYEYDGFGRLVRALDQNGSVISINSYHYKK